MHAVMSSERDVNAAGRALAEGACYFLEKPILLEDLKHVWQHVYRKRGNPLKESLKASNEGKVNINISKESQGSKTEESGSGVLHGIGRQHMTMDPKGKSKELEVEEVGLVGKTHVRESENTCIEWHKQGRSVLKRANDDHGGDQSKPQEKRSKFSSEQIDFVLMRAIEEGRKDDNKSSGDKKSRFLWGPELHLKFTAALSALGDKSTYVTSYTLRTHSYYTYFSVCIVLQTKKVNKFLVVGFRCSTEENTKDDECA
jgi:hypothetical protein